MSLARYIPGDLLQVFKSSYTVVLPQNIIRKLVGFNKNTDTLQIFEKRIPLANNKLFVVGAGKGAQFLAREIDAMMGFRIEKGIISIPEGSLDPDTKCDKIYYYEGAKNNLPDEKAESTAKLIKKLVMRLTSDDVLLVLITGGGSALLPLPISPITLEEKTKLIKKLANSGADITQLNIVRKRISDIKGGKLADCSAAKIVTLIISDIVNDPFDLIACGPTVKNNDDPKMALDILKHFKIFADLPDSIKGVLERNEDIAQSEKIFQNFVNGTIENTENKSDPLKLSSANVMNFLLASNQLSIGKAKEKIHDLNIEIKQSNPLDEGYIPVILSRSIIGNVKDVAMEYYKLAQWFGDYLKGSLEYEKLIYLISTAKLQGVGSIDCDFLKLRDLSTKSITICLILAGETTVEVKGTGKGGRNQHLALEFSKLLHMYKNDYLEHLDIYMLSAGTDGIDGPTDAAGAIGHIHLFSESIEAGINVNEYLDNNDSYTFYKIFKDGKYHIKIGHTNTNVMDIHLITIKRTK